MPPVAYIPSFVRHKTHHAHTTHTRARAHARARTHTHTHTHTHTTHTQHVHTTHIHARARAQTKIVCYSAPDHYTSHQGTGKKVAQFQTQRRQHNNTVLILTENLRCRYSPLSSPLHSSHHPPSSFHPSSCFSRFLPSSSLPSSPLPSTPLHPTFSSNPSPFSRLHFSPLSYLPFLLHFSPLFYLPFPRLHFPPLHPLPASPVSSLPSPATLQAFCTECVCVFLLCFLCDVLIGFVWRSDWLKLLGWLTASAPAASAIATGPTRRRAWLGRPPDLQEGIAVAQR